MDLGTTETQLFVEFYIFHNVYIHSVLYYIINTSVLVTVHFLSIAIVHTVSSASDNHLLVLHKEHASLLCHQLSHISAHENCFSEAINCCKVH